MRYRLRTLLIVLTVACILCGWHAYLQRIADFHRGMIGEGPRWRAIVAKHPNIALPIFMLEPSEFSYHRKRANDFDHAFFRPWLAILDCEPGSVFGAPIQSPSVPIVKRLSLPRDDGSQQDY